MTKEQAEKIHAGDTVVHYKGTPYTVASIRVRGIAAPYFRLHGFTDGLVSYKLCRLPPARRQDEA